MIESERTYNGLEHTLSNDRNCLENIEKLQKPKTCKIVIDSDIFSDFCAHSSIHGAQYLGEKDRYWVERLVWMVCLTASLLICCYTIGNIWRKWDETPVIVSFSERSTSIWSIPFPAITICPLAKTRREIFNYTDFYIKYTENSVTGNHTKFPYFASLSIVCDSDWIEDLYLRTNQSYDVANILDEIAPILNKTVYLSYWIDDNIDLRFYKKIFTNNGVCYTLNGIGSKELYRYNLHNKFGGELPFPSTWNVENGYEQTGGMGYPFRTVNSGPKKGIAIYLISNDSDFDYPCGGLSQGFNVLIHSPDEVPHFFKHSIKIPASKEVAIIVEPRMTTTTTALRNYHPEKRQCFFPFERKLKYFYVYNQNNCEIECLANYTEILCNCVQFWIPAPEGTPVCDASKYKCTFNADREMNYWELTEGITTGGIRLKHTLNCNCLPSCTSIEYSTTIAQSDFDIRKMSAFTEEQHKYERTFKKTQLSCILIGFRENSFFTSKRSELYGLNDFIANCGGILGLFMGVSALSFVEIVYFCCIRYFANKKLTENSYKINKNMSNM